MYIYYVCKSHTLLSSKLTMSPSGMSFSSLQEQFNL